MKKNIITIFMILIGVVDCSMFYPSPKDESGIQSSLLVSILQPDLSSFPVISQGNYSGFAGDEVSFPGIGMQKVIAVSFEQTNTSEGVLGTIISASSNSLVVRIPENAGTGVVRISYRSGLVEGVTRIDSFEVKRLLFVTSNTYPSTQVLSSNACNNDPANPDKSKTYTSAILGGFTNQDSFIVPKSSFYKSKTDPDFILRKGIGSFTLTAGTSSLGSTGDAWLGSSTVNCSSWASTNSLVNGRTLNVAGTFITLGTGNLTCDQNAKIICVQNTSAR
jgi:hypothetical protein